MAKWLVDAGHGGKDSGVVGIGGVKEKDVVLFFTNKLYKRLRDVGIESYRTRSIDVFVELADRGKMAKKIGADFFISIHCNGFNGAAQGYEYYVHPDTYHGTNKHMADTIHQYVQPVLEKWGVRDRGLRKNNYAVLRWSKPVNGVLIELGFLDNKHDNELLQTEYMDDMIEAIVKFACRVHGLEYRRDNMTAESANWIIKKFLQPAYAEKHAELVKEKARMGTKIDALRQECAYISSVADELRAAAGIGV